MPGYFGVGIYHPKFDVNVGSLLRSAQAFDAAFVATVGRRYERQASDTTNVQGSIPLYEYTGVESLLKNLPKGTRLVGVEQHPQAQPLTTYCHPKQAFYLLGAEDHGIPPAILNYCHEVIEIPEIPYCLNVAVAGSIVLYDRWRKEMV